MRLQIYMDKNKEWVGDLRGATEFMNSSFVRRRWKGTERRCWEEFYLKSAVATEPDKDREAVAFLWLHRKMFTQTYCSSNSFGFSVGTRRKKDTLHHLPP